MVALYAVVEQKKPIPCQCWMVTKNKKKTNLRWWVVGCLRVGWWQI